MKQPCHRNLKRTFSKLTFVEMQTRTQSYEDIELRAMCVCCGARGFPDLASPFALESRVIVVLAIGHSAQQCTTQRGRLSTLRV